MITSIKTVRKEQIKKKRLLERELDWLHREFADFHTISDLELCNMERFLYLNMPAQPR